MADIQSIFLPRRGKKSTMNGTKKTQVLAKGELFIEAPDTGVGTGHARAKIGDGATQYSNLPYAWGDTENDKIAFTSNTSTTVAAALNSVVSGNTLATLIAGLKQAIYKSDARVTELNDDIGDHNHDGVYSKIGHGHSSYIGDIYVGDDGKLHKKTVGGADTVLNFSGGGEGGTTEGLPILVFWKDKAAYAKRFTVFCWNNAYFAEKSEIVNGNTVQYLEILQDMTTKIDLKCNIGSAHDGYLTGTCKMTIGSSTMNLTSTASVPGNCNKIYEDYVVHRGDKFYIVNYRKSTNSDHPHPYSSIDGLILKK